MTALKTNLNNNCSFYRKDLLLSRAEVMDSLDVMFQEESINSREIGFKAQCKISGHSKLLGHVVLSAVLVQTGFWAI